MKLNALVSSPSPEWNIRKNCIYRSGNLIGSLQKSWISPPSTVHKPIVVMHIWHPSTWGTEEKESEVQGHSCLYCKFKASLSYRRLCHKGRKQTRKKGERRGETGVKDGERGK